MALPCRRANNHESQATNATFTRHPAEHADPELSIGSLAEDVSASALIPKTHEKHYCIRLSLLWAAESKPSQAVAFSVSLPSIVGILSVAAVEGALF